MENKITVNADDRVQADGAEAVRICRAQDFDTGEPMLDVLRGLLTNHEPGEYPFYANWQDEKVTLLPASLEEGETPDVVIVLPEPVT
jgi:hypothetical protein